MPARRRRTDSESDNSGISLIVNDHSDEKKKYNSVPNKSAWNLSNINNFIQQQLVPGGYALLSSSIQSSYDNTNYLQQQQQQQQQQQYAQSSSLPLSSEQIIKNSEKDYILDSFDDNEIIVMTARDRTMEFSNAIRSLQGRNIVRAVNIRDPKKATQMQSYSEFMMIAKHVGKNIASSYTKLEKLTLLAKRKSLFDDRPAEIQELTYIIKGDLNSLNQQIARLQELSKSQRRSTSGKHLQSHSSNMVLALQSKLANMSTDFKQVLEVRTENLKQQKTRRDQFSQGPISNGIPPSTLRGTQQPSLLLSTEQDQVTIDFSQTAPLLPGGGPHHHHQQQQQQQQQQMVLYDESDNYVQQRAETMQNIESTIVELGGIFQQLAHMVKEQEEVVERIDTNIQDAEMNIEAAHGQILKYFQTVSKNRWLMIKIFGVLIFFFIFFVIFLA